MGINIIKCLFIGLGMQAEVVLQLDSVDAICLTQRFKNEELRYYERTHSPKDEGFECVMAYWQQLRSEMAQTDSLHAVLLEAVNIGDPSLPFRRALMEGARLRKSLIVEDAGRLQGDIEQWLGNRLFWMMNSGGDGEGRGDRGGCDGRGGRGDGGRCDTATYATAGSGGDSKGAGRFGADWARRVAADGAGLFEMDGAGLFVAVGKRPFVIGVERKGALLKRFEGRVRDSVGIYDGELDASLRPEGYGIHNGDDGTYREGNWHEGVLDGWGLSVQRRGLVLCGQWRMGRFLGERISHDEERVYGIDISRYQHDIGRRVMPISWNNMHITRLSHKVASGGYPVTFAYIKASQGTTIVNRYYISDARAARRVGIPVGAYHFFSPTSGFAQAEYFLATARPQIGDLPPMLDVELTEAQIAQMGGEAEMFAEIEAWVYTVQKACGTRPLLYMGQNFVVRHLPNAPMTLQGHPMWVARYSEYRPFVRLAFWQLSQSGRVNGIHGNVDINIYNGTRAMFDEWCQQNAVR